MTLLRPSLVCLNLQRTMLDPGERAIPRALNVLPNAQACLFWARRQSIPVTHVYSRAPGDPEPLPIQGFQATTSEIVAFKRSASIFDTVDVARHLASCGAAFVLGFTGFEDCFAAALDARRLGVRLVFVIDAIASPSLRSNPPELSDAFVGDVLGNLAATTTTLELLRRESIAFASEAHPLRQLGEHYERQ